MEGKRPYPKIKAFMEKKGLWTEKYQKEVEDESKAMVDEAVKNEEAIEHPEPKDCSHLLMKN